MIRMRKVSRKPIRLLHSVSMGQLVGVRSHNTISTSLSSDSSAMESQSSEQEYVENWLNSHEELAASIVKRWLQSHPNRMTHLEQRSSKHMLKLDERGLLKNISVPVFNPRTNRRKNSELRRLNRQELFMELLRDVVSPDFDVNSLSHKILVNVILLTDADRSSLFLVEGSEDKPVLVSKLFDVTENSTVESAVHEETDAIKMPVGVGIAGYVAQSGETVNLEDAYKDPRFNKAVDIFTGYQTKSILCMPIQSPDGEVIGVAQVINKKGDNVMFTREDEEDFQTYLTFCAIGLINAQLFDQSFALSRRLQVLLQLTRGLFEDTTSLELMMKNIMLESQELIPCERCTVMLINQENKEEVTFSQVFQMDNSKAVSGSQTNIRSLEAKTLSNQDLARHVATTAQPVNISHGTSNTQIPLDKDVTHVLCMPIFNGRGHTIGVARLTNKLNGMPFNQADQDSFEVYVTFCGLGIHNVMNYEKIFKSNAKQTVALEMLSYHASASVEETEKLMTMKIPEAAAIDLCSFNFDDLAMSENQTVLASVRMFTDCGFLEKFGIDQKVLLRWVLTVKKNYRPVTYHNWRHAFNVAQTMYAMFTCENIGSQLSELEKLGLLIACFCHDLDHRGTNNAFQSKADSPLAQLYTTSTMEHHHFDHCIMILNSEGNQLLNRLTTAQYSEVIQFLESAILSTDLALYFKKKNTFQELVKDHKFDWDIKSHRDLLRGMLMTACDVSAITKPWKVQRRVAELVTSEFFEQGDMERVNLKIEPIAMMDRQKKDELPKMQVGFIDAICGPLYEMLAELLEELAPLNSGCKDNRKNWQSLAENPPHSSNSSGPHSPELISATSLLQDSTSSSRPIQAWKSEGSVVEDEGEVKEERPSKGMQQENQGQVLSGKRKKPKCQLC